eukprot:553929-Prymnesium_polylepis.2
MEHMHLPCRAPAAVSTPTCDTVPATRPHNGRSCTLTVRPTSPAAPGRSSGRGSVRHARQRLRRLCHLLVGAPVHRAPGAPRLPGSPRSSHWSFRACAGPTGLGGSSAPLRSLEDA